MKTVLKTGNVTCFVLERRGKILKMAYNWNKVADIRGLHSCNSCFLL